MLRSFARPLLLRRATAFSSATATTAATAAATAAGFSFSPFRFQSSYPQQAQAPAPAEPPFTMTGTPVDKLIVEDHNKLRTLWSEYQVATNTAEVKQKLGYAIIRELSMHSAKEEEVVYPEIAKRLGAGERDHLLAEHQKLKDLLCELDSMSADKDVGAFDQKVRAIMQVLWEHVKEEEERDLPRLAAAGADLIELGKEFERAAAHAVTRPHPWAPNKPPMNVAANMATAPLDAARDAVRFGGHPPTVNPQ